MFFACFEKSIFDEKKIFCYTCEHIFFYHFESLNRIIPKEKRNKFPAEMFKYPPLTFQDLLTARGTRAPTASLKRIEDFEEFLKNRKKKEEPDDEPKEVAPTVSYYSCGSMFSVLIIIIFLITVSILSLTVISGQIIIKNG